MMCIDFDDVEPEMDSSENRSICECEYFRLEEHELPPGESLEGALDGRFAIITVVEGTVGKSIEGAFFLVPHGTDLSEIQAGENGGKILVTTWPLANH